MNQPSNIRNHALRKIEEGIIADSDGNESKYEILNGWSLELSADCDRLWKKGWFSLIKQIQNEVPDESKQEQIFASISTEDLHWDWFTKAIDSNSEEYEWFHLYANDLPQAACLIYHPEASALQHGDIFYIKFVAVAPWNRKCDIRARQFGGLGQTILRAAQRFSMSELGLRPGFCLHSLPKAEGFYEKLEMIRVESKKDDQSLAYFELPEAHARKLLKEVI